MRALLFFIALLFTPAAHAEQTLADITWLKGCWRTEAPREAESGSQITEVWLAPPMPAMIGYSYTFGENEVQGWEAMRIEVNGRLEFVASPDGAWPTRFQLVEQDDPNRLIFENAEHDFPKRVEYRREGRNRLIATISGDTEGDAISFIYNRIRCEGALRP